MLPLFLESVNWVHRRTETIQFLDASSVTHRITSDIDVTACSIGDEYLALCQERLLPQTLVPIGLLAKRALLGFDLRDQSGSALSLLTQHETTQFAVEMVMELARTLGQPADLFRDQLTEIVDSEPEQSKDALNEWIGSLKSPEEQLAFSKLWQHGLFQLVVYSLSEKFVAFAVCATNYVSQRCLIKYEYVTKLPWRKVVLTRRVAWEPVVVELPLPLVRLSSSYHVEARAPDGIDIVSAGIWKRALDGNGVQGKAELFHGLREGPRALAHLYVHRQSPTDRTAYCLRVALSAQRRGLVRGALVAAAFPTVVLWMLWLARDALAGQDSPTAASLVLIVPGLAAAWISRPNEHELASRLYLGLRSTVLVAAGCAFAAAAVISLELRGQALSSILVTAAIVSTLCFAVALIAYIRNTRDEPSDPS